MMNSSRSLIPHLTRAILEKKFLQQGALKPDPRHRFTHRCATKKIPCATTTRSASTAAPRNPRTSLPKASSGPPKRKATHYDEQETGTPPFVSKDPKRRQRALYIFLTGASLVGGWMTYVLISATQDVKQYKLRDDQLQQDEDVSDRWLKLDRDHDAEVDAAEKVMFMRSKRKRLIREAYGDVLEVSVGTGRNMDLYDTHPYTGSEDSSYGRSRRHLITSLTFNDQSPVMIENAKQKWEAKQKERRQLDRFTGQVHWAIGDAGDPTVLQRPPGGFDTIIQSYGICSMKDPVRFLRHLSSLARQPGERIQNSSTARMQQEEQNDEHGGRIFLLEHGKGHYAWLNNFLDNMAPLHADRYGCWFNKDIQKVVNSSGLIVERVHRYHAGTTWEIVLRPAPAAKLPEPVQALASTSPSKVSVPTPWWKVWD